MAARSVQVHLTNNTPYPLKIDTATLQHGIWSSDAQRPPEHIAAGVTVTWKSESDGFQTDVEGMARYNILDGTDAVNSLLVHWVNPYFGPSSCSHELAGPYASAFKLPDPDRNAIGGNDANMHWTFSYNTR